MLVTKRKLDWQRELFSTLKFPTHLVSSLTYFPPGCLENFTFIPSYTVYIIILYKTKYKKLSVASL